MITFSIIVWVVSCILVATGLYQFVKTVYNKEPITKWVTLDLVLTLVLLVIIISQTTIKITVS